jgi:hypothetical protein
VLFVLPRLDNSDETFADYLSRLCGAVKAWPFHHSIIQNLEPMLIAYKIFSSALVAAAGVHPQSS